MYRTYIGNLKITEEKILTITLLMYGVYLCVCICMHACYHAHVEIREVDFPHHMGPEIKLRLLVLVVSTFTC